MIGSASPARPTLIAALMLFLCTTGCLRRDGRNSDCRWPSETITHSATGQHLSEDAEFAEDLAIRYTDVHHGLRTPYYVSGEAYVAGRNRCIAALFQQIAEEHGVPIDRVYSSLGQNRTDIDIGENLPFALLYFLAAAAAARLILKHYPPAEDGWFPGAIMLLFVSLVFALVGTMLGESWSFVAETYRLGNSHMSLRADRLVWVRHRTAFFVAALIVFWLASAERYRRVRYGGVTKALA